MLRSFLLILLLLPLGVADARAVGQPEPAPEQGELTLEEAVARAVDASHRLGAATSLVSAAEAGRSEAAAARLPRLELSQDFQRTTNPVYVFGNLLRQESFAEENFELDSLNSPEALSNFSTRVSLFQPVWTGGCPISSSSP